MRSALAFLLLATPGFAGPGDGPATPYLHLAQAGCPPGLAKKKPPCVPPGQARQLGLSVGDRFDGDGRFISGGRFGLPPLRDGEAYVRVGDNILRLDREERIILDIIALVIN